MTSRKISLKSSSRVGLVAYGLTSSLRAHTPVGDMCEHGISVPCLPSRQYRSSAAYVSTRQHTSAHVSIRQHTYPAISAPDVQR
jgi:hypothetical protein